MSDFTFLQPNTDQQSEVFTKMAESFTELVLRLNGKRKDEFFMVSIYIHT